MKNAGLTLILAVLLTPGLLFADDAGCPRDQHVPALELQADQVIVHEGLDSKFLFYSFDQDWSPGKGDLIEFEVEVNGEAFLVESIELLPGVTAGDTVELLAREPEQLDEIYRLRMDGEEVGVAVRVNGQLIEELQLEELIGYNHLLKQKMAKPRAAASNVERFDSHSASYVRGLAIPTKQGCEDACMDDYIDCATSCAGVGCEVCDLEYDECLYHCDPTCTPKTETVIEEVLVGTNPVGPNRCFLVPPFYNWSARYVRSIGTIKLTEKQITTLSDCTVNVTVVRVWYEYFYCWDPLSPLPCSPATRPTGLLCF